MSPYTLKNFEIQKYYQNDVQVSSQNEPKFNGVYSRNNLLRIKDGVYVKNLDEFKSIGAHWIALVIVQPTFTVLELSIFQKKLQNSLEAKIL